MLRRRLLVGLPAAATAFVIAILLGPGQPRAVVGARLHGSAEDGRIRSLRVITVARVDTREAPAADQPLALHVGDEAAPRWRGVTNARGAADLTLDPPIERGATVRLVDGSGGALASGPIDCPEAMAVLVSRGLLSGTAEGELTVTAALRRGIAAPSFTEDLEVSVKLGDALVPATLEIELTGGEPATAKLELPADGRARLPVLVLAEPADLEIRAVHAGGARGSLRARLPVVMGGFVPAATASGDRVTIFASGPRDLAFVSYFDGRGRIGGETLALSLDGSGYHRGEGTLPEGTTALRISSDALESASSTTSWPAPGHEGRVVTPKLELALNGVPDALARERARIGRVRIGTVAGLGVTALVEILLLLSLSRAARSNSERARGSDPDSDGSPPEEPGPSEITTALPLARGRTALLIALVAGALLILAFAGMAALAVLR